MILPESARIPVQSMWSHTLSQLKSTLSPENDSEDPIIQQTIRQLSFWFQIFDLAPVANRISLTSPLLPPHYLLHVSTGCKPRLARDQGSFYFFQEEVAYYNDDEGYAIDHR